MKKVLFMSICAVMMVLVACSGNKTTKMVDDMVAYARQYSEAVQKNDTTQMKDVILKTIDLNTKVEAMTQEEFDKADAYSLELMKKEPGVENLVYELQYAVEYYKATGKVGFDTSVLEAIPETATDVLEIDNEEALREAVIENINDEAAPVVSEVVDAATAE